MLIKTANGQDASRRSFPVLVSIRNQARVKTSQCLLVTRNSFATNGVCQFDDGFRDTREIFLFCQQEMEKTCRSQWNVTLELIAQKKRPFTASPVNCPLLGGIPLRPPALTVSSSERTTPWCCGPRPRISWLQNPTVAHLVKKFPALFGTWSFITMFIRARHWILLWASWIQSTSSHLQYSRPCHDSSG
jgi:hypothetical protein